MSIKSNEDKRIIVSLTSYPARIKYVYTALLTILNQTRQADDIILWLAEEQFPNREEELPKELFKLIADGTVTLRWCDDLKPHKKYFYAFQEYHDDLVLTIDDDLLYPPDMIEKLYGSYLQHPNAVSAMRAHLVVCDEIDGILPYDMWVKEYRGTTAVVSLQLLCTGGAGALYPVHLFNLNMLDKQVIMENCPYADDIWLKMMELVSDIPVALVEGEYKLSYIENTQEERLYQYNITHNDEQLMKSINWVESKYGIGFVMDSFVSAQNETKLLSVGMLSEYYCGYYTKRIEKLRKQNAALVNSSAYRIGRLITWPGRRIKTAVNVSLRRKNDSR